MAKDFEDAEILITQKKEAPHKFNELMKSLEILPITRDVRNIVSMYH